ncbi:MAG: ribonucleoside triphosphate reductase [Thermoprotei archaeon]|nr:MAG: ribonucleoside triphosphate reductase [Thermoprotei archaeon]RLF25647.1 MAG: ribonucleoside triphosphate reductase [Thermoprotei archaeon]
MEVKVDEEIERMSKSDIKVSEEFDKIKYDVMIDVEELVNSYLYDKTWLVRENANSFKTFTGLFAFVAHEVLKRYALFSSAGFPRKQVEAHLRGDLHIHDLPYARFVAYCAGWSLRKLLKEGLDTPNITTKPAKHLSSAVDHIVNFLATAQQEWAGAQAFSSVDLYLAPFIRHDKLDLKQVEQEVQRLIFNLNFPSRAGAQTPFTNFTLNFTATGGLMEEEAIVGGKTVGRLGDYIEEAMIFTYAMIKTLEKGDARGRPFTFPIPTIGVGEDFDWNGRRWTIGDADLSYEIFRLAAERGSFYFLNYLNGYINPNSRFAMCCRLLPDVGEICKHFGGIWTAPEETGSIGVVTINLPRIGYLAKDDDDLYALLDRVLEIARQNLMNKRIHLERVLKEKPYDLPITSRYLGTFQFHYNTVGIVGMHECLMNFAKVPIWDDYGIQLAKKILRHILNRLKEFQAEDGVLYNLEQTPAESTSHRLAMLDAKLFRKAIEKGEYCIQGEPGAYYYTNSTHVPYNAPLPLHEKIRVEAEFHPYFTGGCVTHIWLFEMPEVEALRSFVRRVMSNTKLAYMTVTPTITVCLKCRKSWVGIYERCPECGGKYSLEVYSRIVGYYRPVRLWNKGKKKEFLDRVHYSLDGEYLKPRDILKEVPW